jgi:hypothetical protein
MVYFEPAGKNRIRSNLLVLWALALLAVYALFHDLFFGRIIATTDVLTNDLLYYNYPLKAIYSEALRHGHLLQWSPSVYCGFPVFAEGQGGFLYPPNIVLSLLLPPLAAINAYLIVHALIMGFGMYKFARLLCKSAWAAIPAGVAAAICGSLVCGHTRHLNAYAVIALTPYLFAWTEELARIFRTRPAGGNARSMEIGQCLRIAAKIGLTGGLMALAGHPQFTFIAFACAFGYFLVASSHSRVGKPLANPIFAKDGELRWRLRGVCVLLLGCVIALIIGWPQLRETAELTGLSGRSGGISAQLANQGSLPWWNILTFVNPYFNGDMRNATFPNMREFYLFWEGYHYAGTLVLLLSFAGLAYGWKRKAPVRALAALGAVCYLLSVGGHGFVYPLLRAIPVVGAFRFPGRWLVGTEIAVMALSSYGMKSLLLAFRRYRGPAWRWGPCVFAGLLTIADIFLVSGRQVVTANPDSFFKYSRATAKAIPSGGRVYSLGSENMESSAYSFDHGWNPSNKYFALSAAMLPPNLGAVYHARSARGYTSLSLKYVSSVWGDQNNFGLAQYCYKPDGRRILLSRHMDQLLKLWNVETVLSIWKLPAPFVLTNDIEGILVYGLPNSNPRAWVTRETARIPDDYQVETAIGILNARDGSGRAAFVNGVPPRLPANSTAGRVDLLEDSDESVTMKAETAGLVVLTDTWYPRWRATVDGKPAPILRVNMAMRGVVSSRPGAVIHMWYDNRNLPYAIALSYAVLLVCAVTIARRSLFSYFY